MLFLSSFINFCSASNLLWSLLCFFNFLAFWPFPWQRQPFWKNQHLKVQLHMAYAIPTRFHKVWSRYLREMCRTNFWRKKERKKKKKKKKKQNPPFLFPWQLQQSLSNRFDLLGLSRFTRCGCCSYQVSSISVRRVTC